ncbi:MAG TPA: hypothetical protein VMZ33_03690, partial [Candidatus Limnocylindrales bacterium]|nr:hypothetical protein [Candidatus Limnocylindrales bacterium]
MTRTRVSLLASGAALTLAISIVSTASAVTRNGWSNVGSNGQPSAPDGALNARVHAIAVSGTDVYVGGMFTGTAGLNGAGSIAKWDGSSWSTMPNSLGGGALNGRVNAILVDGSSVFVGGYFQNAGGDPQADYLAVWNGSTWSDIDGATTGDGALAGEVHSLAKHDSNLYVGGTFFNAPVFGDVSGNAGDNIVRWDG